MAGRGTKRGARLLLVGAIFSCLCKLVWFGSVGGIGIGRSGGPGDSSAGLGAIRGGRWTETLTSQSCPSANIAFCLRVLAQCGVLFTVRLIPRLRVFYPAVTVVSPGRRDGMGGKTKRKLVRNIASGRTKPIRGHARQGTPGKRGPRMDWRSYRARSARMEARASARYRSLFCTTLHSGSGWPRTASSYEYEYTGGVLSEAHEV